MNIGQLTPCMTKKGDAISNYVLEIREILIKQGLESCVYVENSDFGFSSFIRSFRDCKPRKDDIVIFHASTSSPLTGFFKELDCKKIMIYHNSTPGHFFQGINERIAILLENYHRELASLIGYVDCVLCDSEFNRQEVEKMGFANAVESPIFLRFERLRNANPALLKRLQDGFANIIYVGRIIPNKKVEDVIKVFYYYQNFINPRSKLFLVGNLSEDTKAYYDSLIKYIKTLQLKEVYFTNSVSDSDLAAYYQSAQVFLMMSEHEGMCLPLLEAMSCDVPVIAYHAAAIPFTLGNAGVLVKNKNPRVVAELIDLILQDKYLRKKILQTQKERLQYFEPERLKKQFLEHVCKLRNVPIIRKTEKHQPPQFIQKLKMSFSLKKHSKNGNHNSYSYLFQHPESLKEIKMIYIQPKGVGDIIMSTPILRELKMKYPFALLDFAAEDNCKEIIAENPNINQIYSFQNLPNLQEYILVFRPYLKTQYMVDWQNTGIHIVDLYAKLCGVNLKNYQTEIVPKKVDLRKFGIPEDYICLHTESSLKYKDWPYFNELIKKRKDKFNIVVIDQQQHFKNTIQLPTNLSLREKAYIVSRSKMLIGVDSMGIHMACAFNIPTIALYGNTLPELCKPLPNENLITLVPRKRCTEGWHHSCKEGQYCIWSISVEEVLKGIERMMLK